MTKDQKYFACIDKINEMAKDVEGYLRDESKRLMGCYAIELEDYKDDYTLPKIILTVALRNCANQYVPWGGGSCKISFMEEIKNLEHF